MSKKTFDIFPYSWHVYEENGSTGIRIFGLNNKNENVFILVQDFLPYVYVELPNNIPWSESSIRTLCNKLEVVAGSCCPIQKEFYLLKKFYFFKPEKGRDGNYIQDEKGLYVEKTYPFLKCHFGTVSDIKNFGWKIKKEIYIGSIGKIQLKMHEQESNPILQFQCARNIYPTNWFSFVGKKITSEDTKESSCPHEFIIPSKNFLASKNTSIARPLILSFDIEVNSTNPNKSPSEDIQNPGNRVFQISCVLCRNGDKEEIWEKYLLTLCKNKKGEIIEADQEIVGTNVEIRMFETEGDLLEGFTEFIQEKNPNIVIGYNIFLFDIPYMYERSKVCGVNNTFDLMSPVKGYHAKYEDIKWSSKAYGKQEYKYMDAHGIIWFDLYPVIFRDYKLNDYRLKTVSDFFLGQTKDDLSVKGIFKCYKLFTAKSLGVVGKYCVCDSFLVLKLFEKLQMWIGHVEMSNTCNVPIFTLYTQGQQIKMYSQVYRKCLQDGYVIDKTSYDLINTFEEDKYAGAYVFNPIPGLYDMVTSFDFCSLYPSAIIAYNIDYTTFVNDPEIPDDKCHIFKWHDCIGGPHDNIIRKTKIKAENVICTDRYFRFLKEPKGMIPTLLENLLAARKRANKDKKALQATLINLQGIEREDAERMVVQLDKRQLSFKINCNSMYGAMGARKGYLPFLPGAMCTTFKGRVSIEKAVNWLKDNHDIKLIYGDTDSAYFSFPQYSTIKDAKDLDRHCREIENEVSIQFPPPMKLSYEEHIYWKYLIVSKKRYMALTCDVNGKIEEKMTIRGVLLNRRDNSEYIRNYYSKIIMKAFYNEPLNQIIHLAHDEMSKILSYTVPIKELSITKSVGDVAGYKIRALSEDDKKCSKRLESLDLLDDRADLALVRKILNLFIEKEDISEYSGTLEYLIFKEYVSKALPGQVQLAERMRSRGTRVDVGERLGYVITEGNCGLKGRLSQKMEDVNYFKEHTGSLKIDPLYYIHLAIKPFDEILSAVYGTKDCFKNFYKARENYSKVQVELNGLFTPNIILF